MLANYGYRDGSGEFYVTIDTDKCSGCGDCVLACPGRVLSVGEDENDPMNEAPVAAVSPDHRRRLKESCASCKPDKNRDLLPCVAACPEDAISHSW